MFTIISGCELQQASNSPLMKIVFPSYLSFIKTFALFSIVSTNPTLQTQTTSQVPLINNSFNHRSLFLENDFEESLESMNNSNHNNVRKEKLLTSTTLYRDAHTAKFQDFSTVKSPFHIFQIKTGRLKSPGLNKINEQYLYPGQPLFHKIYTFPQAVDYNTPEKRGFYFGTFYPMLYQRNHFKDYPRSLYHPYFHKNYDLRNANKRFMIKRHHLDRYVIGNNAYYPDKYYPDKRFKSFYPQVNVLSKSLPSFLLQVTTDYIMRPYTIPHGGEEEEKSTLPDISNEKSRNKVENLNVATHTVENIPEYLQTENLAVLSTEDVATNGIKLLKSVLNETLLNMKYQQKSNEKRILKVPDDEDAIDMKKKESNQAVRIHSKQERSEPTYNTNNSKSNNLNLPTSNRVYYEKMPSNLNVSWFVYVSCSRERCQLTNSTNETELMNEGWKLHNCTNHGCREMYPETKKVRMFIGLMLLVFSICILKIVVFLLVFYYCRSIKLTKNDSEERERLIEEDGSGFPFKSHREGTKRDIESTNRPNHNRSAESADTQLKEDNRHIAPNKSEPFNFGPSPKELSKINSKVWIPPVQNVSPCLVAAAQTEAGDYLEQEKGSEKKINAVYDSGNLQISNMKCLNSSPKLGNWLKCNTSDARKEAKTSEPTSTMNELNIKEQNTEEGELLLMDVDDEIFTNSSRSPNYSGQTSSWEILLEKECKDFINFDLSDEETYRK